jgi:hypothetical protein
VKPRVGLLLGAALVVAVEAPRALANESVNPAHSPLSATALRPFDAPRLDESSLQHVPTPPPEYLTHDEGWLRIHYHPSTRDHVRLLLGAAAKVRRDLAQTLGAAPLSSMDVRIAAVPAELAHLSPVEPPSYTAAVAYSELHLILLSLASPRTLEPPHLMVRFRHALAHVALDEAVGRRAVPRWFHEGFATHFAEHDEGSRFVQLMEATMRGQLLALSELEASFPADVPQPSLAYAESADFVRFLQRGSNQKLQRVVGELAAGRRFDDALSRAYATPIEGLERAWREDLTRRYVFLPVWIAGLALSLLTLAGVLLRKRRGPRVSRAVALLRAKRLMRDDRAKSVIRTDDREERTTLRVLVSRGPSTRPRRTDADVPKVEHDGRWHTLH